MQFLEKNLEDIIWETSNEKLRERGFLIGGKKLRQLRIGNYGVADIVTYERKKNVYGEIYLEITVFELKKEKAGISAFLQAIRYCKGIKTYLEDNKYYTNFKLRIVICGKEIDVNSDYIFLTDTIHSNSYGKINSIENFSFNYSFNGIIFNKEYGYNLTNKGW